MTHWLFIDMSNLAYRFFHVLSGPRTGASKFILADVIEGVKKLGSQFNTDDVAFCFDVGEPKRRKLRSTYKNKALSTPGAVWTDEQEAKRELQGQLEELRTDHLPAVGFKNVLGVDGYEADDVIASLCKGLTDFAAGSKDKATIVSNDQDFWQLLWAAKVDIWNHKELLTEMWFRDKFGFPPDRWVEVEAMAGDVSDCIRGVDMVGETKAAQFIRNELPKHHLAYKNIVDPNSKKLIESNIELIELPFDGCPKFKLAKDAKVGKRWKSLEERLGIGGLV